MSGLFVGLMGGAIAGSAITIGTLPFFVSKNLKIAKSFYNFDFLIGLLLVAILSMAPSWVYLLAGLVGIVFYKSSKFIIEDILMNSVALPYDQWKAVLSVLLLLLKNIPVGLLAGATLSFPHYELGVSILALVVIQNILDGFVLVNILTSVRFSSFFILIGVSVITIVEVIAAVLGGYISVEINQSLPFILSFVSGALICGMVEIVLKKTRKLQERIPYTRYVSGMVVMLIFIIWKELL